MLAPAVLPPDFKQWNAEWGAPSGYSHGIRGFLNRAPLRKVFPAIGGPFSHQLNNDIRSFEYPWAFHAVDIKAGMQCVDLGGSHAGFQFVLARAGLQVTNVDPGEPDFGWILDRDSLVRLNKAFSTDVRLENSTLMDAHLESERFDVVYSISTIEHVPKEELPAMMAEIHRILRPGGSAVLTVDLFLDVQPFDVAERNYWGCNVDLRWLIDISGLNLAVGNTDELYGFLSFDACQIKENLNRFLVGSGYPALAQCLVLRKPL
jgi:2-polyprenyl-3-methyl-5-hydroxy-6-metoxy-1,4-benzoquinol methylase